MLLLLFCCCCCPVAGLVVLEEADAFAPKVGDEESELLESDRRGGGSVTVAADATILPLPGQILPPLGVVGVLAQH